jgi:Tfp pilus assembly protein PilW
MSMIGRLRQIDFADESGLTLMELLVAVTAGIVVMAAITTAMLTTVRETGRIADHVEANQRARLAMTSIVNDLQSACIAPNAIPIQIGSTGQKLIFTHQVGEAVLPTPVKSEIELSGTSLIQKNYPALAKTAGEAEWKFSTTATPPTETIMSGVAPLTPGAPIFTYYAYSGASVSATPLAVPIAKEGAEKAVQVSIAFEAAPAKSINGDTNAATEIRNSALLRMTAPSYSSTTQNLPCE